MLLDRQFPSKTIKDESRVWEQIIAPVLTLPSNVFGICQHGFTKMLNNVIDHANSQVITLHGEQDARRTLLAIEDDGIGVFTKLREYFHFDSDAHALMELVKGKLTVAPQAHSGEGIFFSSKMFDRFVLESGELSVTFEADQCVAHIVPRRQGTRCKMEIANDSQRTTQQVFARFTDPEEFTFCKTRFFVSLATLEGELISRSQAKRVVSRFENFTEVELDFHGVDQIGQAFADELIRVWPLAHPATRMTISQTNEAVAKMLRHVLSRSDLPHAASVFIA